ncbi:MAG: hypothetical protein ACFNNB_02905 [Candidatus Saccharimonas sp.]|jgi:hypothetical protein
MKIEDGFNASPKAPSAARQLAVNTGLVVAAVSMALLTGVVGYTLGMQSSSSRSLAGSQGAAPGGSLQQGSAPGDSGSALPQTGSSAQQPPNQTSQPTSNMPAQNQGANQTAPKTNPQPSANSTSNT